MLDFTYVNECYAAGYTAVCGIDEAGRGPLAGNVVAAAVILPHGLFIEGLNDSKKLSEKKREALFEVIMREAVTSVAWATPAEIDELNILNATMLAMNRAVKGLPVPADFALIDGNTARGFEIPTRTIVGGDAKCPSVAAASIRNTALPVIRAIPQRSIWQRSWSSVPVRSIGGAFSPLRNG